uniref:ESX-1 associated ATP-binding protein EpsI N-terminal domain-containing protein n=1 Tax=Mycobacterium florentinum TaxID=292462 RepID=UPI0022B29F73|nr:hypothetical protein [Mycobacterium florentinum]
MGADYDRLFQPPAGGEIPDATADSGFDIDAGFDVDAPAAAPPMPVGMPKPNAEAPPPMPVDWTEPPAPARPEPQRPPMPVHPGDPPSAGPETHRPPMPVDATQPPPAPPGPPRPPMPVSYDELFAHPDGTEIPEAGPDFDLDSGFDTSAAPMPVSPPVPNGHARPPMPVDWEDQPPPARAEPSPARPEPPRPPMPVDWNNQPPPTRPKPPPIEPVPPAAPPPPARRARPRDVAETRRAPTGNPAHGHGPNPDKRRGKPAPPPRPRPTPPGPTGRAPQLPPTQRVAVQPDSAPPTRPVSSPSRMRLPASRSSPRRSLRPGWFRAGVGGAGSTS